MHLSFEPLADRAGIAVVDRLERQRYRVHTSDPVDPTSTDTDAVDAPVGAAVAFETAAIELPTVVPVYVRDADGTVVAEVAHLDGASLPAGSYTLDLGTQIKSYLAIEGSIDVSTDLDRTRIDLGEPTRVVLGGRSSHERPAATVTTTSDPRDCMRAVETFGSALQSLGPERSYPTLRGHPPALQLGDELAIPDGLERPDTGVTLHVRPTLEDVFVAAPLAYYLGAAVEPSDDPRLETDDGFVHPLGPHPSFETAVGRTLKRCFLLDCVTRTEGDGPTIRERADVEAAVDLDVARLYESSLAEQVAAYLSVPHDAVAEFVPEWRLVAHVDPVPESVASLPFVVDDLAIVRTEGDAPAASNDQPEAIEEQFTRDDVLVRSASAGTDVDPDTAPPTPEFVEPEAADALEQAWIGDRIPIGASKCSPDAFRNRLDRDPTEGDISIRVVANDDQMAAERDVVDDVYGDRDDLTFDVTVHENLTTTELATVLQTDADFFHYIGHTTHDGFRCRDGKLDATTLDSVAVDTFLLNACNSYHQGLALVERGAIGGIVTLNQVLNSGAVTIGETVARLLNCGFPLRAALGIARDESFMGAQYIVVGDGGINVAQAASGTPNLVELLEWENEVKMELKTYATDDSGLGSVYAPKLLGDVDYNLNSGSIGTFDVSRSRAMEFLRMENVPVRVGDSLYWSYSERIEELLR
jgi:hypothetical protein